MRCVAVVVVLVACSSEVAGPGEIPGSAGTTTRTATSRSQPVSTSPPPSTSVAPSTTAASPVPVTSTSLPMVPARVPQYYALGGRPIDEGDLDVFPFAISSDGDLFVQDYACGTNVYRGSPTKPPDLEFTREPGDDQCVAWSDADADYIVWESDTDPDIVLPDWTIWSYSRHDHQVRQLARWSEFSTEPVPSSNFPIPHLDHGLVVWSAAIGGVPYGAVLSVPVDGSAPAKVIVRDGIAADYSYPFVAYASLHADGLAPDLAVLDLVSGETRDFGPLPSQGNLAIGGSTVIVVGEEGAALLDVDTGATTMLSTDPSAQWPSASADLIGWSDNASSWVYIVATGDIIQLGSRPGGNWVQTAGRHLMWYQARDPALPVTAENWDAVVASV